MAMIIWSVGAIGLSGYIAIIDHLKGGTSNE